eukprot:TRINITY_DN7703_c0_g1_i2.p1 TRINITY_DN7703_c0_g1~~TRINITY_DN7703_c0_g1_i2.p1  ORF type:complete len:325 (-),score=29.67 TRINITY_DN7703_c0_g1_i2:23-997(-)
MPNCWWYFRPLLLGPMLEAAEHLIGRHWFQAFTSAAGARDRPNTMSELYDVQISCENIVLPPMRSYMDDVASAGTAAVSTEVPNAAVPNAAVTAARAYITAASECLDTYLASTPPQSLSTAWSDSRVWLLPQDIVQQRVESDDDNDEAGLANCVDETPTSSLRSKFGCDVQTNVPTKGVQLLEQCASVPVLTSDVYHEDDGVALKLFRFTFTGRGFLRYMVRRLVSMLAMVGDGRHPPDCVRTLLAMRTSLPDPGITAPAQGLVLETVLYDPPLQWPHVLNVPYPCRYVNVSAYLPNKHAASRKERRKQRRALSHGHEIKRAKK